MAATAANHGEMRERILAAARTELREVGPAALSMRAISRAIGVTVGALYRYFDGRDALLTELIVEAYDAIGAAFEAEVGGERSASEQWCAAWHAVRDWAIAHPHEFHLIYGTPVIGYEAPERTVAAASRITVAIAGLVPGDLAGGSTRSETMAGEAMPGGLRDDFDRIRAWFAAVQSGEPAAVSAAAIIGALRAWTELIGTIAFELSGHYVGSINHGREWFDHVVRAHAEQLDLRDA